MALLSAPAEYFQQIILQLSTDAGNAVLIWYLTGLGSHRWTYGTHWRRANIKIWRNKSNRMCVTSNSMLQFLSSSEMQFLNKIKAWMMTLDTPNLQRGEFRYLLETLGLLQSAGATKIKFSRRASRVNKNKSLHCINLPRSFTWKRWFVWIIKSETFAYLNGKMGSVRNWKWGHPSIQHRLYQSCMVNKQRNHHIPECVRPATSHSIALCMQSAFLFACCFITFSFFIDGDWGAPASTAHLWWQGGNGDNAFITCRWVCETAGCFS